MPKLTVASQSEYVADLKADLKQVVRDMRTSKVNLEDAYQQRWDAEAKGGQPNLESFKAKRQEHFEKVNLKEQIEATLETASKKLKELEAAAERSHHWRSRQDGQRTEFERRTFENLGLDADLSFRLAKAPVKNVPLSASQLETASVALKKKAQGEARA